MSQKEGDGWDEDMSDLEKELFGGSSSSSEEEETFEKEEEKKRMC